MRDSTRAALLYIRALAVIAWPLLLITLATLTARQSPKPVLLATLSLAVLLRLIDTWLGRVTKQA